LATLSGLVLATLLLLARLLTAAALLLATLLTGLITLLLLTRLLVRILILSHIWCPPNIVGFYGSKRTFETFRPIK